MSNSVQRIILAIDIGTSSVKALALTQSGEEIFQDQQPYTTYHPQPGFSEQHPDEIYQAVKKIIRGCSANLKENISAISFSSAMHSIMAVDEQSNPLTPLIIWSDLRSEEESKQLQNNTEVLNRFAYTGTPIHPMSPLCKLIWLKKYQPEVFERAHKFIGIKEFIWHKFFQHFEIDQGMASATGLLKTGTYSWFEEALAIAGITADKLSVPVSIYHHCLLSNPSILNELGFSKPVNGVIGSSDGCLAHMGSFALYSDALSLTIGTSGAVRWTVKDNTSTPKARIFRYHLDEQTLIEGGASNNGAVLIDWFSKNFLKENINAETFIQRAMKVSPGAEGLIFLPYVFGERAPVYNPEASGVFFGIRQHHTTDHFMRAIVEGIGYALYSIVDHAEAQLNYSYLVASGGFAHSHEWVQVIADIFGKPVHLNQHENASAVGAAMVGFKALGIETTLLGEPMKVVVPDAKLHSAYQKFYSNFRDLCKRFSDESGKL